MEEYYLGIDPSTKSTGFAIANQHGELLEYGKICPQDDKNSVTPAEHIFTQYSELVTLMNKYPFKKVWCEDQFFGNNVDTLKKLCRVSGMVLLISAQYHTPVELVYPAQWRKVFHGKGNVKKTETLRKVNEMFNLKLKITKDNDVSDAIGIVMAAVAANNMGEQ